MGVDERGLTLTDGYTHSFKTAIDCLTKEAEAMDAENRVGRASMLRSIVEELQDAQQRRSATSPAGDLVEAERVAALVHTQRATARILRERGPAVPGWHPSWADHMEAVADALEAAQALRYQSTGVTEAGVERALAAVESRFPGSFWHMAKGRTRATEPLFAFAILFGAEEVLAMGEGDTEAEAIYAALSAQERG